MANKKTKVEVSDDVTRQVAIRRYNGDTWEVLEKELGISKAVLRRVSSSPMARDIQKGALKTEQEAVKIHLNKTLLDMADLVAQAIKKGLEEGKVEYVKTWMQVVGMSGDEKHQAPQLQALQVILPSGVVPKGFKDVKDVSQE